MGRQFEAGRFVQESYNDNNLIGMQLLVAYLVKKGYTIKPETFSENYNVDIVAERNGIVRRFEVEMKDKYNFTDESSFPFDTVSFLGRKEKWKNNRFIYCVINKKNNAAIFADSNTIFKEEYKEVLNIKTAHRNGKDLFYRVPKELCKFITPEDFFVNDYQRIWNELK